MHDEKTLEWLSIREANELLYGGYYCVHCKMFTKERDERGSHCLAIYFCRASSSFHRDAADFEARVAAKLAEKIPMAMRMARVKDSDYVMSAEIALMLARIEVEHEMEKEK